MISIDFLLLLAEMNELHTYLLTLIRRMGGAGLEYLLTHKFEENCITSGKFVCIFIADTHSVHTNRRF